MVRRWPGVWRHTAHGRRVAMFPAGHDGAADSGSHVMVLVCGETEMARCGWEGFVQFGDGRQGKKGETRIDQ
ncbi:hypothetical protein E2C01_047638 [Portunus trituberculatus]|uniref:Uncharacterized protein n=1 Tax=Portunus trituberculatus TaxID=210409 RepID=A0A5B7G9E7_PORTR|nr:hypothetical protein [Portunus trituberculatus]